MAGSPNDATDELTLAEKADLDGLYLKLATCTLYEFLGVSENADRKSIRDAYFALSKHFHPDAFYGRNLGKYGARIEEIFRELTHAYDVLSNKNQRAEYDLSIGLSPTRTLDAPPAPPPSASDAAAQKDALRKTGNTSPIAPSPSAAKSSTSQSMPQVSPPGSSALRSTGEHRRSPSTHDQPAVIPPPLRGPEGGISAPRPAMPKPAAPVVRTPEELARAKEALARKLTGSRGSTGEMAAVNPAGISAGAALRNQFANREDLAVAAKLAALRDSATRLEANGDISGAANTLQIAVGLAPEDSVLRTEFERVQRRSALQNFPTNQKNAQDAEKSGDWNRALTLWHKALLAKPDDYLCNLRTGVALWHLNRELPKAAEFARKALAANPRSVEAYVLLGEIFLAADKPASARRAAEEAAKLDPTSLSVKDLLTRTR